MIQARATGGPPSDLRIDTAWVGLAIAIGAPDLAANWPRHVPWLGILAAVGGTLACLSLVLRRERPVAVAAFTVTVAAFSPMAVAAAILAVTIAALSCRPRTYALLAGYLLALIAVDVGLALAHTAYGAKRLDAFLPAVLALGTGMAARMQQSRRQSDERRRIEGARSAERSRMAREMHDVLAHRISMVSVHAGALEFHPDAPSQDISRAAGVIRASAHAALGELREVINLLRDSADSNGDEGAAAPQPTLMEVPELVEESRRAGTSVSFELRLDRPAEVPSVIGRTVYRIVQEGLTNARKHARGSEVEVVVADHGGGGIAVSVVTGPRVAGASEASRDAAARLSVSGSGTGLIGLTERAELVGGSLRHGPTPDGGYAVRATLPRTA